LSDEGRERRRGKIISDRPDLATQLRGGSAAQGGGEKGSIADQRRGVNGIQRIDHHHERRKKKREQAQGDGRMPEWVKVRRGSQHDIALGGGSQREK